MKYYSITVSAWGPRMRLADCFRTNTLTKLDKDRTNVLYIEQILIAES
jgi:hypothetical protein